MPGVGAFDAGMINLHQKGLDKLICTEAKSGKPILGICLGMQLLGRNSEEGKLPGLGLIPFDNIRFRIDETSGLKVPHMGWDIVNFQRRVLYWKELQENKDTILYIRIMPSAIQKKMY